MHFLQHKNLVFNSLRMTCFISLYKMMESISAVDLIHLDMVFTMEIKKLSLPAGFV